MTMEKIVKDAGDIQSRLIDHRPVIQGEIRYFMREFERWEDESYTVLYDCFSTTDWDRFHSASDDVDEYTECVTDSISNCIDEVVPREKRGFRECRLLENLSRGAVEQNEHVLPNCSQTMQQNLHQILTRLEAANHMANRIQQRELEAQQSTHMQVCMERRKADWEEFLKQQAVLKEEVDEEHAKAVSRLSSLYTDMKKDLGKFNTF